MANELAQVNDTSMYEDSQGFICTADLTTDEGRVAAATAINGAESLKDHVGEVLHLKDVMTMAGKRAVSESPCTNTYLILTDGTVLFSQSDGVARGARVITKLWGGDFGEDGIAVVCKETALDGGRTLKSLVPVTE